MKEASERRSRPDSGSQANRSTSIRGKTKEQISEAKYSTFSFAEKNEKSVQIDAATNRGSSKMQNPRSRSESPGESSVDQWENIQNQMHQFQQMEDAQRLLDQAEAAGLPTGFDPSVLLCPLNISNGNAPLLVDQAEYASKTQNSGSNGGGA